MKVRWAIDAFLILQILQVVLQPPCAVAQAQHRKDSLLLALGAAGPQNRAEIMVQLAELLRQGRPDSALALARQAEAEAKRQNRPATQGAALAEQGMAQLRLQQPEAAIKTLERAVQVLTGAEAPYPLAKTTGRLGQAHAATGDFAAAIPFFQKALAAYEDLKEPEGVANEANNLATSLYMTGKLDEALEAYQKALDACLAGPSKRLLGAILTNMSSVAIDLGRYREGIAGNLRALAVSEQRQDSAIIVAARHNIGTCYFKLGKLDSAITQLRQAAAIGRLTRSPMLGENLSMLAEVFFAKHPDSATATLRILDEAEQLARATDNQQHLVRTLLTLGRVRNQQALPAKAIGPLAEAAALADTLELLDYAAITHRELANALGQLGRHAEANQHLLKWASLRDSMYSDETLRKLNRLEERYEQEKLRQAERETARRRQLLQWALLAIVAIGALALAGSLWQFRANLKRKKAQNLLLAQQNAQLEDQQQVITRQNQELEEKLVIQQELTRLTELNLRLKVESRDRELASTALLLAQKAEILEELRDSIKEPGGLADMQTAIESLRESAMADHAWNEFRQRFEQVHPQFFTKLATLAPDLTPNEVRLGAFIRMNLAPKEIALFLNVQPRSAYQARRRLKKKLGLGEPEDLDHFILSL